MDTLSYVSYFLCFVLLCAFNDVFSVTENCIGIVLIICSEHTCRYMLQVWKRNCEKKTKVRVSRTRNFRLVRNRSDHKSRGNPGAKLSVCLWDSKENVLPVSWDTRGNLNARSTSDNPSFIGIPKIKSRSSESLFNENRLEIKSAQNSDSLANCSREVNSRNDIDSDIKYKQSEIHYEESITSKRGPDASDIKALIENTHVKSDSESVELKSQGDLFSEKIKLNTNSYRQTADKEKVSARKERPVNAAHDFETVIVQAGTKHPQPTEVIRPKILRDKPIRQIHDIDAAVGRETQHQHTSVSTKAMTGEMAEISNISDLVQKAQTALNDEDTISAKRYSLQAIAGANIAKDRFLTDVHTTITDQHLADWYGGCSFVMNQIGDNLTATRCFYTATVFDPNWTLPSHIAVSDVLWTSLIYFRDMQELFQNLKTILNILSDLDKIAKLAERRKRWSVCVAVDGDINKVYRFLNMINLTHLDIMAQPGRKEAMSRTARCYLHLGRHQDVRKLCSTILQHVCDYDDSEALEIWARSLFATEDFDLALSKNELALKYCQHGGDKQRLEEFHRQIQQKLEETSNIRSEPDESWLEGTSASAVSSRSPSPALQRRSKKRHKRPKARDRSGLNTPLVSSKDSKLDQALLTSAFERLKRENTVNKRSRSISDNSLLSNGRSRNASGSSVATCATGASVWTEGSVDYSVSESDSEEDDDSFSFAGSWRTDSPELHVEPLVDPEEGETAQDDSSYYEQSCRFYQNNSDYAENEARSDIDENILKNGIHLNISFMNQFEDKNPNVTKRDPFYTAFLSKDELRQKLLMNPKKYLRCVIQIEGAHEAYCYPVDGAEAAVKVIEISGRSKIGQSFNEDEVVVEIFDDQDMKGKIFGKVLGIWSRQPNKDKEHPVFICTLDTIDTHLVRPMCKTVPKLHALNREISQRFKDERTKRYKIEVYEYDERAGILCNPKIYTINPADAGSHIFLVAYVNWGIRHIYPRGAIIKILPSGKGISTGLAILNLQHEVPTLYRKETVNQVSSFVERMRDEPPTYLLESRKDLTQLNVFTIDPQDSKDLDDALSIEETDDGYKVGVHIADVSIYIPKDSPLDEEAKHRATTFYPGICKPRHMLPEPLSSSICSLVPNKIRLTISIFFYYGTNGRLIQTEGNNYEIVKSYIRSRTQLTYGQVQRKLFARSSEEDCDLDKDIRCLFILAKKIRKHRLGNSMFALDMDWEEYQNDESENETVEAHYLVEEFMIMANKKIAEKLLRTYRNCIPLRCQPPPSQENIDAFFKRNNQYMDIIVRMQDKQIGPKRPNFDEYLKTDTGKSLMISKTIWEAISEAPNNASKYLRTDDYHPLQLVVYQHWLSIQERAGYKCSGGLNGEEDGKHHSLDMFPYTHFTSPIRRYNDLVVHRLVHAAVFERVPSPYTKEEVDNICIQINSVAKRAKEYEKGCRSLQQAVELKTKPKMIRCYIDEVTDRALTLSSPFLKYVAKQNRELTFNLLDMGYKPEVLTDTETTWDKVKAVWRKRLYNFHVKTSNTPDRGHELQLNPHKGLVFLPLQHWARMLKCAVDGRLEDLACAIKRAKPEVSHRAIGHDDVSTECCDPLLIQPNTKFSMTFFRGQEVQMQMTAAPFKGVIAPKPMLYNMTRNVKFCLQHTDDPVLHLYYYVTRPTCDTYPNVRAYLERWLPIILMESATGILRNEESCCISDVSVKFLAENRGKFALGLAECEVRNIELSGTLSDEEDDDDEAGGKASSYDWLCLKKSLQVASCHSKENKTCADVLENMWVGHAEVTKVKKNKEAKPSGKLTVSFRLHEKAPAFPATFHQTLADLRFDIEILKKTEVDRRTESFIKQLPSVPDSLATKIALNKPIPGLDKSHIHAAKAIEHDLSYDGFKEGLKDWKPMPKNNNKQQEAIDKALESRFSLIQGPPGTGKTDTGIKLIYLFDRINHIQHKEGKPRKQVLFCGPSNKSVDLVAKKIYIHMHPKFRPKIVRVYGKSIEAKDFPIPGRTFLSKRSTRNLQVPSELYPVALHHLIRQKGKKHAEEINAFDKLFKQNNYEPMPEKVREYVSLIREASIDEIRKHDVILCTTAVGSNPKVLKAADVYQVIVDESGMCPEPQCLVPIIATGAEQVVLIGDHKQLRPIIMCKEAALLGLETSLFERYATSNSAKNVKFTMLEIQYRMDPEICRFPSKQFYENKLITGSKYRGHRRIWPKQQKTTFPHVFVHVEGEEKILTVSTEDGNEQSRSNDAEIEQVAKIFKYFQDEQFGSVQILSQYNAQCSEIRRRLRDQSINFNDENVTTVVSSQGGEWDYIIFSTVRSLPEYKIEKNPTLGWCKHNLGFITDRNQVNVALTRARRGLVIIGNKNLLACDYVWKRLLQHYEERGCIKTPEQFPPEFHRPRLQKMEENIFRSERRYGEHAKYIKGEATSFTGPIDDEPRGRRFFRKT